MLVSYSCDVCAWVLRVPQISVQEAANLIPPAVSNSELPPEGDASVFVDKRSDREFQESMLPNAVTDRDFLVSNSLPKSNLGVNAQAGPVVVYCTAGFRSAIFAFKLRRKGISAVNLRGGILEWSRRDLPLVGPDGQETRRVHVYGKMWRDLVGPDHEARW